MAQSERPRARGRLYGNQWLVLVAASIGLFLVVVDSTIVNISIPAIITGLKTNLADVEWVLNGYTLVFASLLIPLGRIGDMFGRKRVFLIGLLIFGTSSALCGLAPNIGALIAARVVQATGAAAMMPATLSLVQVTFQPAQRGLAFGLWAAISGFGIGIGPTLGGFLTQYDWRYIFFVNVPIVMAAVAFTWIVVPESKDTQCHEIDWTGGALWIAALTAFNYALIQGPAIGWGGPVPWLFVFAVAGLGAFLWYERHAAEPMMDLHLFRNPAFSAGNFAMLSLLFGAVGSFFLIPLFLQDGLGYSALKTGLALAPIALVLVTVGPVAGWLSDRVQPRVFIVPGMLLVSAALAWMSTVTAADTPLTLLPRFLVMGCGMGLALSPMTSAVMGTVPAAYAGSASGMLATAQRLGAVMGVAVLGAVLQVSLSASLTASLASVPGLSASAAQRIVIADEASSTGLVGGATSLEEAMARAGLTPAEIASLRARVVPVVGASLVLAMSIAFRVGAVVLALGALVAILARPRVGAGGAGPALGGG